VWDYYTAIVETLGFMRVEELEEACEQVRGMEATQEDIANALHAAIKKKPGEGVGFRLTVKGQHGQNCTTTVML